FYFYPSLFTLILNSKFLSIFTLAVTSPNSPSLFLSPDSHPQLQILSHLATLASFFSISVCSSSYSRSPTLSFQIITPHSHQIRSPYPFGFRKN
ncbi:hypothetical protein VIGAN_10166600, partial [Vigna angularis var. angularis]